MTLFESVKNSVSAREAAERYGLQVGHNGMCKCPFHDDKNPSMKLYEKRYHCFGCQADGDVISFTGRLFNISPKDAAMKLADDFGIPYDQKKAVLPVTRHCTVRKEEVFDHKASFVYWELVAYRNQLIRWKELYAPKSPDEDFHPRFVEALTCLERIEYQLDILLSDNDLWKTEIVDDYLNNRRSLREELQLESIDKIPVYHHSAAYAREHNELEQFRESHRANIDCKLSIEKAIARHFDGYRLEKKAIEEVIEQYGPERIGLVLAATIQTKAWDGRFSTANKDWAFTFDFPEAQTEAGIDRRDQYAVTTHPAILDGFINLARQEFKALVHHERNENAHTSVSVPKPAKHKSYAMER